MQFHGTNLRGYRNVGDYADKDYEQQSPAQGDLVELIHADNGKKLFEFAQKWSPFTRIPLKQFPADDREELRAIYDTRELILLVLSIKSLLDNGSCNDETLREIGFHIDKVSESQCEYGIVSLPSGPYLPEWVEEQSGKQGAASDDYASKVMVPPNARISEYSGAEIKERRLYLPSQAEFAESLASTKTYKVFEFGITIPAEYAEDPYNASRIMDEIMQLFLENISTYVERGIVKHGSGCNMLSFWLLVSERFEESRIQLCKACGLPLFASAERGEKRQYCEGGSCKRQFMRAKRFMKLVNDEGMSRAEASKKTSIASSTAERILLRNNLYLRPPSEK